MENCHHSHRLLTKIKKLRHCTGQLVNTALVEKAILYAKKVHDGQYRDTGEPYFTHPLEVAYLVSDHCLKTDILITAILHDVIEDTGATQRDIEKIFGDNIARHVMDLTRVTTGGIKTTPGEIVSALLRENKHELLLVKLFDRLHNIRTLHAKSANKAGKIARETLLTFVDLALCLGMPQVAQEMTQLCKSHVK